MPTQAATGVFWTTQSVTQQISSASAAPAKPAPIKRIVADARNRVADQAAHEQDE